MKGIITGLVSGTKKREPSNIGRRKHWSSGHSSWTQEGSRPALVVEGIGQVDLVVEPRREPSNTGSGRHWSSGLSGEPIKPSDTARWRYWSSWSASGPILLVRNYIAILKTSEPANTALPPNTYLVFTKLAPLILRLQSSHQVWSVTLANTINVLFVLLLKLLGPKNNYLTLPYLTIALTDRSHCPYFSKIPHFWWIS